MSVTHGRCIIDRYATHILAFDVDIGVQVCPGSYESWRAKRMELRAAAGLPAEEGTGTHRRFSGS